MRVVNGSYWRSFTAATDATTAVALSIAIAIAELGCRLLEHPINLPRMQCVCILRHLLQQYAVVLRRELR